jgi:PilZ domain
MRMDDATVLVGTNATSAGASLSPLPPARTKVGEGWASLNIEGLGDVSGAVVGFDTKVVVVALELPAEIVRGRAVVLALGIDGRTVQGIEGTTMGASKHHDGRLCVAVRLNSDGVDSGDFSSRRSKARIPFEAKVDALVVTSRKATDKNYKFQAIDLSTRGLGAVGPREIPSKSGVLLRFAIPPHRGSVIQLRAFVSYYQRISDDQIQIGFEFERVTSAQLTQLNGAVMYLSHQAAADRRAASAPRDQQPD